MQGMAAEPTDCRTTTCGAACPLGYVVTGRTSCGGVSGAEVFGVLWSASAAGPRRGQQRFIPSCFMTPPPSLQHIHSPAACHVAQRTWAGIPQLPIAPIPEPTTASPTPPLPLRPLAPRARWCLAAAPSGPTPTCCCWRTAAWPPAAARCRRRPASTGWTWGCYRPHGPQPRSCWCCRVGGERRKDGLEGGREGGVVRGMVGWWDGWWEG